MPNESPSLSATCPLCQQRSVDFADVVTPWHQAFCTRVNDCGYWSPQFRSREQVIEYHNGVVTRLFEFLYDCAADIAEPIKAGTAPTDAVDAFIADRGLHKP